jgi:geranylgeranyl diphosphate synthase type II
MQAVRERVNEGLAACVADREPDVLYDPIRYVLDGDGKRIRPVLLLLVADALGTGVDRSLPAALAVEVFHNFTLVHDDIMDGSDERRGRPTVHTAADRGWDASTAILTGDMMLGLSYDLLARLDDDLDRWAVQSVYHPMVEQLCRGQALDEALEDRADATVDDYLDMIDGKTVALFAACFEIGAILGGADADTRETLRRAGQALGRGFQIQDDLIDLTGDRDETGKPVGGDLVNGKKTYVTLQALQRADGDRESWLRTILEKPSLTPAEVDEARSWMREAGVFEDTEAAFTRYFTTARSALDTLPDHPSTDTLHYVIDYTEERSF